MSKSQDYLNIDPSFDETKSQKYVCLSFLTPQKDDQTTLTGIKVRGVFEDYDEACKHAKKLQELDPAFGVFVGEVGKWLPFDPDPDSKFVKSSEYANEELNDIMKNYLINQEKAKIYHEKRKNEVTRKNVEENLRKTKTQYDAAKSKLNKTNGDMKVVLEKRLKTMDKRMEEMKSKVAHLKEQEDKLLVGMQDIDSKKPELKPPEVPAGVEYPKRDDSAYHSTPSLAVPKLPEAEDSTKTSQETSTEETSKDDVNKEEL